jgi:DNA-binding NarL/FixJ family response regulator
MDVSLRCLIVDDNAFFLEAATSLLEREGVTVVAVVSTSADAIRTVRELDPDVVLVDIMLGNESGFDLAWELARIDVGGPAVILISTRAESDFAGQIAEIPAAGFVPKFELSASAIRRLLGAHQGE